MNPHLPFWTRVEGRISAWPRAWRAIHALHRLRKNASIRRARRRDRRCPSNLRNYEARVFSQYGEDGILAELFARIGEGGRFAVEFGVEDGRECNARRLIEERGWSALLIEGNASHAEAARARYAGRLVQVVHRFLTAETILATLAEAGVPVEFDLLSIDVDGNDYWLWQTILATYRPRAVVIEYNGRWPPPKVWVMPYDPNHRWDRSAYYGASLAALAKLGARKGYALVGCSFAGLNAFFVRDDLVADRFPTASRGPGYHYAAPLYEPGLGHPVRPDISARHARAAPASSSLVGPIGRAGSRRPYVPVITR
jgi:hypothetical protein